MEYLFTFWVQDKNVLSPTSIKSKNLHIAFALLNKKTEVSLRHVKRIDIEPVEIDELSDNIIVNRIELASRLAHKRVQEQYRFSNEEMYVDRLNGTVYSETAEKLFRIFYDQFLTTITTQDL